MSSVLRMDFQPVLSDCSSVFAAYRAASFRGVFGGYYNCLRATARECVYRSTGSKTCQWDQYLREDSCTLAP